MSGITNWRAAVFDFDGVLIDSSEAYRAALSEAVAPVSRSEWPKLYGMTTPEAVAYAAGGTMPQARVERLSRKIDRRVGEILAGSPPARAGAHRVLLRLLERGLKLAVASSATRYAIDGTLTALGWSDLFCVVAGREDAPRAKPFPDVYAEAVHRMGVEPAVTFAVEDTDIGIESAQGAGLFVVAVGGTQDESELGQADLYVPDFQALWDSDWFRRLVTETA
jgi:HAD superfamily hydrolase (TIGR01509 family)